MKDIFNSHAGLASNPNGGFDEFRQQLLLVLARKLAGGAGSFSVAASEVDENGQFGLDVEVDQAGRNFVFRVWRKQ